MDQGGAEVKKQKTWDINGIHIRKVDTPWGSAGYHDVSLIADNGKQVCAVRFPIESKYNINEGIRRIVEVMS